MKGLRFASKAGFTLIELLIVVAIIGILSMIALPQLANYRCKAYNAASMSDLRQFQMLMEGNFADSGDYPVI